MDTRLQLFKEWVVNTMRVRVTIVIYKLLAWAEQLEDAVQLGHDADTTDLRVIAKNYRRLIAILEGTE